jgi:hypothetical protein
MLVHIFRGTGRVFGFTEDAAGAKLPSQYGPWVTFKTLNLNRGEATPGVETDACLDDIESTDSTSPMRMSASPKM